MGRSKLKGGNISDKLKLNLMFLIFVVRMNFSVPLPVDNDVFAHSTKGKKLIFHELGYIFIDAILFTHQIAWEALLLFYLLRGRYIFMFGYATFFGIVFYCTFFCLQTEKLKSLKCILESIDRTEGSPV